MNNFQPFANDTQSITVPDNGITFENGQKEINVYGDFQITLKTSVEDLDLLIELLNKIKNNLIITRKS